MSWFRGRRTKLNTPVKLGSTDTITKDPFISNVVLNLTDGILQVGGEPTLGRMFRNNEAASLPGTNRLGINTNSSNPGKMEANSLNFLMPGVQGGQVAIDLISRITQDSCTMSGLAGRVSFSVAAIARSSGFIINSTVLPAFLNTVSVAYAVVLVKKGQMPGFIIPFSNYPMSFYQPQDQLLAYGVGQIAISSNGDQTNFNQVPCVFDYEIRTKRILEQGDYITLIVATNMPIYNYNVKEKASPGGIVQYTQSSRMFLVTSR